MFSNCDSFICILTAYPLSVIVDILDSQWGEHHTNCLSWHTHLRTVWKRYTNTLKHILSL